MTEDKKKELFKFIEDFLDGADDVSVILDGPDLTIVPRYNGKKEREYNKKENIKDRIVF